MLTPIPKTKAFPVSLGLLAAVALFGGSACTSETSQTSQTHANEDDGSTAELSTESSLDASTDLTEPSCPQGQIWCDDHCVAPRIDRAYCGAIAPGCRVAVECLDDETCHNGQCRADSCTYPLVLADPLLEQQLREGLGIDEAAILTEEALRPLTQIGIKDVNDLRGLECLALDALALERSVGPRLEWLGSWNTLTQLHLTQLSEVDDWSPLARYALLNTVSVRDSGLTDLSFVRRLSLLQIAKFDKNPITDLQPLIDLPYLQMLDISKTMVTDLKPLAAMPQLLSLTIDHHLLHDLAPLSGHAGLTVLTIQRGELQNIAALEWVPSLYSARLDDNRINSLEPLRFHKSMRNLSLINNEITDLQPALDILGLAKLELAGNPIPCDESQHAAVAILRTRGVYVNWDCDLEE
jgi:Leucine-rich repeat (LRR) protein